MARGRLEGRDLLPQTSWPEAAILWLRSPPQKPTGRMPHAVIRVVGADPSPVPTRAKQAALAASQHRNVRGFRHTRSRVNRTTAVAFLSHRSTRLLVWRG